MKIGLLPVSAKPYHAGHDGLVRIASNENDSVLLFVSTTDRARSGELRVSGDAMQTIWWDYIEPTLPQNVTPDYGGIPVAKVYAELETAEAEGSTDTYVIYSDEEDILKYFYPVVKRNIYYIISALYKYLTFKFITKARRERGINNSLDFQGS